MGVFFIVPLTTKEMFSCHIEANSNLGFQAVEESPRSTSQLPNIMNPQGSHQISLSLSLRK